MSQLEIQSDDQNNEENPYNLIRKLQTLIHKQKQQLNVYSTQIQTYVNREKIYESQLSNKKKTIKQLTKLLENQALNRRQSRLQLDEVRLRLQKLEQKQQRLNMHLHKHSSTRTFSRAQLLGSKKIASSWFSDAKKAQRFSSSVKIQSKDQHTRQFIPNIIKLSKRNADIQSILQPSILNQDYYDGPTLPGQCFTQDFILFGPDLAQFRRIRDSNRQLTQINVNCDILFDINRSYKNNKTQYLNESKLRAFPSKITMKRRMIQTLDQIRDIVQFQPERKIGYQYFTFSLKGQLDKGKSSSSLLSSSNPNGILFVVCLKLPDFICIRDQKHYHRKQHEIWTLEKIYAFATYYPFFDIHISILEKIQNLLYTNRIEKIMNQSESFLVWQFTRNLFDLEKNQSVKQILAYFANKRPDFGQICSSNGYYFGTIPDFGYNCNYALAKLACPAFFSSFNYQQFLLILFAFFCEKSLIFLSKSESLATLCVFFLVSIIYPFKCDFPILTNCDLDKMLNMFFQCPFMMIATWKKTEENIQEIIAKFAQININRFKGTSQTAQILLIDIDTNTILFDPALNQLFSQVVFSPSSTLQAEYLKINSCNSKSFSLPKTLTRQLLKSRQKPQTERERSQQEKRKAIKQYLTILENNKVKETTFKLNKQHEKVLRLAIEFINSLTIENLAINDFIQSGRIVKQNRLEFVHNYLQNKFGMSRHKFIHKIINSQFYANYMDSYMPTIN